MHTHIIYRFKKRLVYDLCLLTTLALMGLQAIAQPVRESRLPGRQYINAHDLLLTGRGATVPTLGYNRIDSNLLGAIPHRVAELSKNTAGLQVDFITNSSSISFKWTLDKYSVLPNMTPIAKNGLDLYAFRNDSCQFVATAAATGDRSERTAISHLDGTMRHYRLYLPLYSSLTELYIGIDSGAVIQIPKIEKRPEIVIYGTSITQGASASRPGLAYPAILSRQLDATVYNMGFSGSGKMEPKMAEIIGHMPADLYILDCVPNMTADLIHKRAIPFVRILRKIKPAIPILFMESPIRETSFWDMNMKKRMAAQNKAIYEVFQSLKKEGLKNIYYQSAADLSGHDHEATIDGTHLTDVGFSRLTTIVEKKIREIVPVLFGKASD
ncbi:SGNH/GDSL hydrolase family protein [Arachidicoccus terrestris]|uniref:SGNH/GDSL hydrolase family protein n=1 Tax=Arachidicoccus terrestris TaxID=2875539 RepID=UPI001CC7098B|nr:SGNH/GDSL hydrolase family protein [Arachidicoccus terrestris]UAY55606.1 SGNH/GDSL hydrolase family protein [Arachidicoccus terrestris]